MDCVRGGSGAAENVEVDLGRQLTVKCLPFKRGLDPLTSIIPQKPACWRVKEQRGKEEERGGGKGGRGWKEGVGRE